MFPPVATLPVLSRAGTGRATRPGRCARIVPPCAPLDAAFGVSARAWSGALLEGANEQWLKAAGAGDRLRVRQMPGSSSSPDTTLVFVLTS